jgi:hypothetical protein
MGQLGKRVGACGVRQALRSSGVRFDEDSQGAGMSKGKPLLSVAAGGSMTGLWVEAMDSWATEGHRASLCRGWSRSSATAGASAVGRECTSFSISVLESFRIFDEPCRHQTPLCSRQPWHLRQEEASWRRVKPTSGHNDRVAWVAVHDPHGEAGRSPQRNRQPGLGLAHGPLTRLLWAFI